MKILSNQNFNKNELQNAVIQPLASAPSTPVAGQVYYDTGLAKFGTYNGTTWDYMGSSSSTGDFSSNTATAVDGEAIVFSGTGGKTGKRYTSTGIVKATSGVLSSATSGTDYSAGTSALATGILKSTTSTGALTIAVAGDFPTLNQSTTGSAATLMTARTIGTLTGDVTTAGSTFNGSANNTNATVLATVNSNVGSFGTATQVPSYTVNAKGLITAASNTTIQIAESQVTNLVTDLGAKAPTASPTFTGTVTVPTPSNATDAATKGYVDTAVTGLLDFKGSTDTSTNPNYPAAVIGDSYVVSVAGKIGGASGKSVDVGDMYVATANNAGGTEASVGTSWTVFEHNLAGALLASNNLSDVANAATAFGNIKQAASDTTTGVVELATQAEAQAKTDTVRALTPASVADFTRKYVGTIGNGALTTIPVTHGLGSQYVTAQVFDATSNEKVECDIVLTSSTVTTFNFAVAPTTNQYRVVIVG